MKKPEPQLDIRLASPGDISEIMRLLNLMQAEIGLAPFDDKKVLELVTHMVLRRGGIAAVVRGPKRVEATIGLVLGSWWYSTACHLERLWDFVDPDHRRTTHAKDMISYAKRYAEGLGIPLVLESVVTPATEAKCRLYDRQLPARGKLFLFDPRNPEPAPIAA